MKKNINQAPLNALLEKHTRIHKGKTFVNLVLIVNLKNGEQVSFEIAPKFYNHKFDYMLKQNIDEVK